VDRLTQRLGEAAGALAALEEILREPKSVLIRDATIKRFEYTFEAVWKTAQAYLRSEGFDVASPKSVVRTSLEAGLLTAGTAEEALIMIDDRNLTVHMYRGAVAEQIFARIPRYAEILSQWLGAIPAAHRHKPA
jgi:nucleotidyltransferase substrate binding protein (TIGR01987 family)